LDEGARDEKPQSGSEQEKDRELREKRLGHALYWGRSGF
jgi:hypothetical protein